MEDSQGITLRFVFKQDLSLDYHCETEVVQEFYNEKILIATKQHQWSARVKQKVIRAEKNLAHLLTVSEPLEVPDGSQDSQLAALLRRQVMYCQMDPRGNVLESAGNTPSNNYVFPEGPVKLGDTWKLQTMVSLPGMPLPGKCTNTYRLLEHATVNGFECLKIEMKGSDTTFETVIPGSMQKVNVVSKTNGIFYVAPKVGILVRSELCTKSNPAIDRFAFNTTTRFVQELVRFDLP